MLFTVEYMHLGREMSHLSVQKKTWQFLQTCIIKYFQKQVQLLSLVSMNKFICFSEFLNKASTVTFFLFTFISIIYIIKFCIYFCSKFFTFAF
jgi:hypothetical protein